MTKRWMAAILVVVMIAGALTACGGKNKPLTIEQAQDIVLKEMGVSAEDATMHTHVITHNGEACYSIYVTVDLKTYEYIVHGTTGEILSVADSQHSH